MFFVLQREHVEREKSPFKPEFNKISSSLFLLLKETAQLFHSSFIFQNSEKKRQYIELCHQKVDCMNINEPGETIPG